jgi:hypothetical protein
MSPSRREVLEAALAAALAAATPKSLFAMAERAVAPSERFLIVTLRDGRLLAVDRSAGRKAYLMSSVPARDGDYALSKSGSLVVHGGKLLDVRGAAESTEYTFIKSESAIEVRNRQGRTVSRTPVSGERRR